MINEIRNILESTLPKSAYISVEEKKAFIGDETYIHIKFAASDININDVENQKPQMVSLSLNTSTMELKVQTFRMMGGQDIQTKSTDRYYAFDRIRVPFRRPNTSKENVLAAIKKFAENWLKLLKDNKEKLEYSEYVNYNEFLK